MQQDDAVHHVGIVGAAEQIRERNVQLVGPVLAVASVGAMHAAPRVGELDEAVDLLGRQETLGWTHADSVVTGEEVEQRRAWRRGSGLGHPLDQPVGPTVQHRVDCERRKREVVDQMRLVAVTEVRAVLAVGNVRLGDDRDLWGASGKQGVQHLDHLVGLREMDRGRSWHLPDVGDRVEA